MLGETHMTDAANRPPLTLESEDSKRFRHARAGVVMDLVELEDWDAVDRARGCRDEDELETFLHDITPIGNPHDPKWDILLRARTRLAGGS